MLGTRPTVVHDQVDELVGLLPVERLYLQAQKNMTADPATALLQFRAIVQ